MLCAADAVRMRPKRALRGRSSLAPNPPAHWTSSLPCAPSSARCAPPVAVVPSSGRPVGRVTSFWAPLVPAAPRRSIARAVPDISIIYFVRVVIGGAGISKTSSDAQNEGQLRGSVILESSCRIRAGQVWISRDLHVAANERPCILVPHPSGAGPDAFCSCILVACNSGAGPSGNNG